MYAIALILISCSLHAGWDERKAEGWAWYEDRVKKEEPKEKENISSSKKIEQIQSNTQEKLAKALLEPTEENIEDYIMIQKSLVNKSSLFASNWQKLLLQKPWLSQLVETPASHYGVQLHKHLKQQEKNHLIQEVAKEHGLFFFYEGNNPTSKAFAKVVKVFSERHHWSVLAISLDGITLPEFPESEIDNGVSEKFNLEVNPSLFAVNPVEEVIVPVSFGLTTLDQIEDNVFLQFQNTPPIDSRSNS